MDSKRKGWISSQCNGRFFALWKNKSTLKLNPVGHCSPLNSKVTSLVRERLYVLRAGREKVSFFEIFSRIQVSHLFWSVLSISDFKGWNTEIWFSTLTFSQSIGYQNSVSYFIYQASVMFLCCESASFTLPSYLKAFSVMFIFKLSLLSKLFVKLQNGKVKAALIGTFWSHV